MELPKFAYREIDFMPDQANPEQMGRFVAGIKKVYGAVHLIQQSLTWRKP